MTIRLFLGETQSSVLYNLHFLSPIKLSFWINSVVPFLESILSKPKDVGFNAFIEMIRPEYENEPSQNSRQRFFFSVSSWAACSRQLNVDVLSSLQILMYFIGYNYQVDAIGTNTKSFIVGIASKTECIKW